MTVVAYLDVDVLTAARARIAYVFDRFEKIMVSVSSGKDSAVLYHLALDEARRRSRRVTAFFLDQEAEYASTVELMRVWMSDPIVDPAWFQVPIRMTNATSNTDYFLRAWEPGAEWMRAKEPGSIHEIADKYPDRFYPFFEWYERQQTGRTAFLVGLRSKESLHRFRAVTKAAGFEDCTWSTKTKTAGVFRFYPIYDWTFGDVWKHIADEGLRYNQHYDRMYAKHGINMSRMRVSNLVHEKSFRCLADLQEFEPDTYDRLLRRVGGIHAAALYANESTIYSSRKLPEAFVTWVAYRDYLVASTPSDKRARFEKRFAVQRSDETTARAQVKQLLLNDWENSIPVTKSTKDKLRARWWDIL